MNKRSYSKVIKDIRFNFERITKKQARAAYRSGLTVLWCPVNLAPFTGWGLEMPINVQNWNCDNKTFDEVLNEYISYNCNSETGKYPAFYIPTRMIDRFTNQEPTSETLGIINAYDYRYLERA